MNFLLIYFCIAVIFSVYCMAKTWARLGDPSWHPLLIFFVMIICACLGMVGGLFWPVVFCCLSIERDET